MRTMAAIAILLVSIAGTIPEAQGKESNPITPFTVQATAQFNGWHAWHTLGGMTWEEFSQAWDRFNPQTSMRRVSAGQLIDLPVRRIDRQKAAAVTTRKESGIAPALPSLTVLDKMSTTQTTPATTPVVNVTTTVVVRPVLVKIDTAPLATVIGRSVDNIARAGIFVGQAIAARQRQEINQTLAAARQEKVRLEQELATEQEKAASFAALLEMRSEELSATVAQAAQLSYQLKDRQATAPTAMIEHVSKQEANSAAITTGLSALFIILLGFFLFHRAKMAKMQRELKIAYHLGEKRNQEVSEFRQKSLDRDQQNSDLQRRLVNANTDAEASRLKAEKLEKTVAGWEESDRLKRERITELEETKRSLSTRVAELEAELEEPRANVVDISPAQGGRFFRFELRDEFEVVGEELKAIDFLRSDDNPEMVLVQRKVGADEFVSNPVSIKRLSTFLKGDGDRSKEARAAYGLRVINIHQQTTASDV